MCCVLQSATAAVVLAPKGTSLISRFSTAFSNVVRSSVKSREVPGYLQQCRVGGP